MISSNAARKLQISLILRKIFAESIGKCSQTDYMDFNKVGQNRSHLNANQVIGFRT